MFYSDLDNPIGNRRSLREFCKRHGVPTHRAGPRLLVLCTELDAAIVGAPCARNRELGGDDHALLLRAGLVPR